MERAYRSIILIALFSACAAAAAPWIAEGDRSPWMASGFLALVVALVVVLLGARVLAAVKREFEGELERLDGELARLRREHARLKDGVEEQRARVVKVSSLMNSLASIAKVTNQSLETGKVIEYVLEILHRNVGAAKASIWLLDEEDGRLRFEAGIGWDDDEGRKRKFSMGEELIGYVAAEGKVYDKVSSRQDAALFEVARRSTVPSVVCLPVVNNGEVIGVLNVEKLERRKKSEVGEEEMRLLVFLSSLAAMAMKNARMFEQTRELANTDGLTRLYTHRFFQERLSEEMSRARRYGHFISIVLTDIDHFKKFNDTYGHQIGDLVLRETAAVFKRMSRDVDIVARYGGEEFVVVLPQTDKQGACIMAERLRRAVEAHTYNTDKGPLKVTISLGVATFPVDSEDKAELIRLADEALYRAKEGGRNQVQAAGIPHLKFKTVGKAPEGAAR